MNRRSFLRGTLGVMALPALESVGFAQINSTKLSKRLVCIGNSFGFHAPHFFPKDSGKFTDIPPALSPLKNHLKNCTLFSNLDHGVKGGHYAVHSFLSGVKQSQAASMPNGSTLAKSCRLVINPFSASRSRNACRLLSRA